MSERREALRRRVYLGARIVHPRLRSDTACLLRNLSGRGARIAVCASVPLPDRFELVVEARQTTSPVEAVWRTGDELGVRFLTERSEQRDTDAVRIGPPPPPGDPGSPPARRPAGDPHVRAAGRGRLH